MRKAGGAKLSRLRALRRSARPNPLNHHDLKFTTQRENGEPPPSAVSIAGGGAKFLYKEKTSIYLPRFCLASSAGRHKNLGPHCEEDLASLIKIQQRR